MQERVLDLGQNLAKELEHLLPHAGGVLRGRAEGLSGDGAVPLRALPSATALTAPSLQASSPHCRNGPPLCCPSPSHFIFLHNLGITEHTGGFLCPHHCRVP